MNGEFSSYRLMSVLTLKSSFLRPVLFCTILFHERYSHKFEDALTVTCLEDVADGQSARGGLTAINIRNKSADYFLTDAGAASWRMSKI